MPILIAMGKENKDLLNKIVPPLDAEIAQLNSAGVTILEKEKSVEFVRTMNDNSKMQKLLVGRGGAFYILCVYTEEDAVDPDEIIEGFEIGYMNICTLNALYENLEVDGQDKRRKADYVERLGLTQNPITSLDIKVFPILHALLRDLDYCFKLIYKLNAGLTTRKENAQDKKHGKRAKKRVQEMIWTRTGMSADEPDSVSAGGTTTTGNTARLLFDPLKRQVLVDCIAMSTKADGKCDRVVFDDFIMHFSIILRAVSS